MKLTAHDIRLYLLPEVEERIRHYTELAPGEVSGLGTIEESEGGFVVTDLFLPKQNCSQSGTELDQQSVATLIMELDQAGVDAGTLRFWWHSHADMDVFWSPTDEQCIRNLANGDYVLSMVTNKKGAMLARLDIFRPARLVVDDIPVSVRSTGDKLLDRCRQEVQDNVAYLPTPMSPLFQWDDELSGSWAEVRTEMDELEELFMAGEMTWEEYEERLREVGNG